MAVTLLCVRSDWGTEALALATGVTRARIEHAALVVRLVVHMGVAVGKLCLQHSAPRLRPRASGWVISAAVYVINVSWVLAHPDLPRLGHHQTVARLKAAWTSTHVVREKSDNARINFFSDMPNNNKDDLFYSSWFCWLLIRVIRPLCKHTSVLIQINRPTERHVSLHLVQVQVGLFGMLSI